MIRSRKIDFRLLLFSASSAVSSEQSERARDKGSFEFSVFGFELKAIAKLNPVSATFAQKPWLRRPSAEHARVRRSFSEGVEIIQNLQKDFRLLLFSASSAVSSEQSERARDKDSFEFSVFGFELKAIAKPNPVSATFAQKPWLRRPSAEHAENARVRRSFSEGVEEIQNLQKRFSPLAFLCGLE
jgi:hypothetical protein